MQKRLLIACVVALVAMLLCSLVIQLFGAQLNRALNTPLGALPVADVLSVLVAMTAGGFAARHARFRWIAVGLVAVVWIATLSVLTLMLPPNAVSTAPTSVVLKYNALSIVLTLGAAWLGAFSGERWAARRAGPIATS